MPPSIALLLCILFILYLFRIDFKRETHVSRSIWIPLIWVMIIASRPVSLWLNPGAVGGSEVYLEGSPLDRNIYLLLIIIGAYILSRRKIDWSQLCRNNAFIFLFMLYGGISIMWSDFPLVSFKRWIKGVGMIIMIVIILTENHPVEALKTIIRRMAYVHVPLSIVFIKYFPQWGRDYSFWEGAISYSGVTYNKNTLGYLCLISGLFFCWRLLLLWQNRRVSIDKKELYINIFFLVMIVWLFDKASSATSFICLIIGVVIIKSYDLSFVKKNLHSNVFHLLLITLCVLTLAMFDFTAMLSSAVDITGHSSTFWGRTEMWSYLVTIDIPSIIGTGYESFWIGNRLENLWAKYWWRPNQSHNGYLEIYLNLGWIGLILLGGVILTSYRNILKSFNSNFDYGRFRMAFLIVALLYNVTEAAFKGLHIIWFVFLLISINYSQKIESESPGKNRVPGELNI